MAAASSTTSSNDEAYAHALELVDAAVAADDVAALRQAMEQTVLRHEVDAKRDPFARRSQCIHSPLHLAAFLGRTALIELMVTECHADVDARDGMGDTPLRSAIRGRRTEAVAVLVHKLGANVNVRPGWSRTVDPVFVQPYLVRVANSACFADGVHILLSSGRVNVDSCSLPIVASTLPCAVALLKHFRPPKVEMGGEDARPAFKAWEERHLLIETLLLGDLPASSDSAASADEKQQVTVEPAVKRSFFGHRLFEPELIVMIRDFVAAPVDQAVMVELHSAEDDNTSDDTD